LHQLIGVNDDIVMGGGGGGVGTATSHMGRRRELTVLQAMLIRAVGSLP
jgi:hypothetical protein